MFGLTEHDITNIQKAMKKFDEIEQACVFGSRALGNYKKGSDVDIVIKGEEVTSRTVATLHEVLNDICPLPYFFDVVDYKSITNEKLIEHIDCVGKKLYEKKMNV